MFDDRSYDNNLKLIRRTYIIFGVFLLIAIITWLVILCVNRKSTSDFFKDNAFVPLMCLLIAILAVGLMIWFHSFIPNILLSVIACVALLIANMNCLLFADVVHIVIAIVVSVIIFALACIIGHFCRTDLTLAIIHILIMLALCMVSCFCYLGFHHAKMSEVAVVALILILFILLVTLLVTIMMAQTIAGKAYIRTCPGAYIITATFLFILYVIFLMLFIHFFAVIYSLIQKEKDGNKLELPPHDR